MTDRRSRRSLLVGALAAVTVAGAEGCGGIGPVDTRGGVRRLVGAGGRDVVELQVAGATLQPVVELATEVEVAWFDLDTGAELGRGAAPTLEIGQVRRVGMQATSGSRLALDQVVTLNLGFNRDDDYGRLSLDAFYEHDPQPVTAIGGLSLLTGLLRFCASRTGLSGRLDLTGLLLLEHVECYRCEIDSIAVSGCASLVRLCMEDCRLTELDIGPVRRTLQGLRGAIQRSDSLTFAPLDGPMETLCPYCLREQQVHQALPHTQPSGGGAVGDGHGSAHLRLPHLTRPPVLLGARQSPRPGVRRRAPRRAGHPRQRRPGERGGHRASTGRGGRVAPSAIGEGAARELLARGWRVSTN